jgi:hypothetical protein
MEFVESVEWDEIEIILKEKNINPLSLPGQWGLILFSFDEETKINFVMKLNQYIEGYYSFTHSVIIITNL